MRVIVLAFCVYLILPWSVVRAQTSPEDIPASAFAALPRNSELSISPDGQNYLSSYQGQRAVLVSPIFPNSEFKGAALAPEKGAFVNWAKWVNNEYILVSMGYESERHSILGKQVETRLFSFSIYKPKKIRNVVKPRRESSSMFRIDGTNNQSRNEQARWVPIDQDSVIDMLPNEPNHFLLAIDEDYADPAKEVRRVNVKSGKYRLVHNPARSFRHWITDLNGIVRLGYGSYYAGTSLSKVKTEVTYRSPVTGRWLDYSDEEIVDTNNFMIKGFYDDPRYAFLSARNNSGHWALYKYDLVDLQKVETLLSFENQGVVDLIRDPFTEKIVGAYYNNEGVVYHYFDNTYKRLQGLIDGALPNSVNTIVSRTMDEDRYVVLSESDVNPGSYYIFDVLEKQLGYIEPKYQNLDPNLLSPMLAVTYQARDGLEIHGYLTVPKGKDPANLPTIILPHGGPSARDYWGYDYLVQFLASRGYAVFQPNFRGSTGYGKEFLQAGKRQWGLKMQDDVTDGALWLVEMGIADPDRMCIFGWSYGGYAALTATFTTPGLFRCSISVNGISDLVRLVTEESGYLGLEKWGRLIGNPRVDRVRMQSTSAINNVEKINTPILLIAAKDDTTVNYAQSKRLYKKLIDRGKIAEYVEIKDGNHSVSNEPGRLTILTSIEKFLARHIGGGP